MNGRKLDNFYKDFGPGVNYSQWFKKVCMTAGPSSPPNLLKSGNVLGDDPASLTIHWRTPPLPISQNTGEENPNLHSPTQAYHSLELSSSPLLMAFFRADPTPFVPRGLNPMNVGPRKPMERVVLMKPRAKNQDLAIVSIHPMPAHQVTFQAIRDVVTQFLNEENIVFTNMQPTHLGQAYVRFRNAFDRDRLVNHGAFIFNNVSITFVEHNKGRN